MPRRKLSPNRLLRFTGLRSLILKPTRVFLPLLILLLLFFLFQLFFGKLFAITQIHCTLDNQVCSKQLKNQTEYLLGQKLPFIKPGQISTHLLKLNPFLKEAKINTVFPNKLKVELFTDTEFIQLNLIRFTPSPSPTPTPDPTATDSAAPTSHSFLDLLPLTKNDPFETLFLTSKGDLLKLPEYQVKRQAILLIQNSLPSKPMLLNFYNLYQELSLSMINTDSFFGFEQSAAITLNENTLVIFDLLSDPRQSVVSLQQIRSESTMRFERAIIDLRFKNPVISYY